MSTTLNLVDRLLVLARNLQTQQQSQQALHYLSKLAALRDLPAEIAEETHARLGEIRLGQKHYRRARRHLALALLYRPKSARYHFMMATALAKGTDPEPERALAHYRQALEREPEQAAWLGDFGVCCLRGRRIEEGLAALCRAVQLAPNDPASVRKLVKGLCVAGREEEAEEVLRAARFRNPRDGRFEKLWNDLRYKQLIREQLTHLRRQGAGPTLLPLVQSAAPAGNEQRPAQRQDAPAPLPGPHTRRPTRSPDRKKHG